MFTGEEKKERKSRRKRKDKVDVVKKAKEERIKRKDFSEKQEHALLVSKFIISVSTKLRVRRTCKEELDKKLGDIKKLKELLQSQGKSLILPYPNIEPLLRLLVFSSSPFSEQEESRLAIIEFYHIIFSDYLSSETCLLPLPSFLIDSLFHRCLGFSLFASHHRRTRGDCEALIPLIFQLANLYPIDEVVNRFRLFEWVFDLIYPLSTSSSSSSNSSLSSLLLSSISSLTLNHAHNQDIINLFISHVLVIPSLLSHEKSDVGGDEVLSVLISHLFPLPTLLPPSPPPPPSYRAYHFDPYTSLMGNVSCIVVLFLPSILQSTSSLSQVLLSLATLLQSCPPSLLSPSKQTILTRKTSSNIMTASSPPPTLIHQINLVVPALLLELLPLCLLGGEEWRETMNEVIWTVREEERIEMEESVNITSGVEWAENQVTSSSTSSNTSSLLTPPSWASRLGRKISRKGGEVVKGWMDLFSPTTDEDKKQQTNKNKEIDEEDEEDKEGELEELVIENEIGYFDQWDEERMKIWCEICGPLICDSSIFSHPESAGWRTITQLAFSTSAIKSLVTTFIYNFEEKHTSFWESVVREMEGGNDVDHPIPLLLTLIPLIHLYLMTVDDEQFHSNPQTTSNRRDQLNIHTIIRLLRMILPLLFYLIQYFPPLFLSPPTPISHLPSSISSLCSLLHRVVHSLYMRWSRNPFCSPSVWSVRGLTDEGFILHEISIQSEFGIALEHSLSFSIPFPDRMRMFSNVLDEICRQDVNQNGDQINQNSGPFGFLLNSILHQTTDHRESVVVRVRRGPYLVPDGLDSIGGLDGEELRRSKVVVRFINEFGEEEVGIDMGGLFKDFWSEFSSAIFDPTFGLFSTTKATHSSSSSSGLGSSSPQLFPSPLAPIVHGKEESDEMFTVLGRVLGKAILEGITIQPIFTHFFLSLMNKGADFSFLFDELALVDPELYSNLLFLKRYEGDVEDLCLTFTVMEDGGGLIEKGREVDLVPGGKDISVTSSNRHKYVNLMARYHLMDRIYSQSISFFRGLHSIIHPSLLSRFSPSELQVVISGVRGEIDVSDWKSNTSYHGTLSSSSPAIKLFWGVVKELDQEEKSKLLRFVTGCERPPSLGFAHLVPQFTIQAVSGGDEGRLPTASTCFNTLKLPSYSSSITMRQRIITVIESKAGFDLS